MAIPQVVVTDKLRSYRAAMKEIGNAGIAGKSAVTSTIVPRILTLPFRRRERAMSRFRRMRSLQKFASMHSSVYNHFNHQSNIESRARFKSLRDAALLEWRDLLAA
jgi:putative transposase